MQGGKKKVTNKEKKETPWNHGKSSRSKAVVEYREDKVEGKKSKYEQYRNDYSKSNGIQLQHQARNFTFHKSTVTYGNADGSDISSSSTRMTGSDGATFVESKKADTATKQGKCKSSDTTTRQAKRKSSNTATTTRQVKHKISGGLDNKGHSNLNKGGANELLRFEQSWKGNDTRSWFENFSGYADVDVAEDLYEYHDEAEDAQVSSHEGEEGASGQGGPSNWWALKGFLADPCAALAVTLSPKFPVVPTGEAGPLDAWWQQYFSQSAEWAHSFSVCGGRLFPAASEVEGLKAELVNSRSTVGELQAELKICEKHISELEQGQADSRKEILRLEQEVKEANASKVRMAMENEKLVSRTNGAVLAVVAVRSELKKLLASQASAREQLEKTRSLLVAAEEAQANTMAEVSEKTDAMLKLQEAWEVEAARGAEREKELWSRLVSEVACRAESERELSEAMCLYEADVAGLKLELTNMKDACAAEAAKVPDIEKALFKAEALQAVEVAKAADREKALAKAEAVYIEMVVKLSERDQSLAELQVELAMSKSMWKRASSQVEATIAAHGKRDPAGVLASEMKDRDDLIVILRMKLRDEKKMLRKLCSQLRRVPIVRNIGWYRGYVWGFETFRALMRDDDQRANFEELDMNDFLVDPSAMEELVRIGREEFPDAPNLDSTQLMTQPLPPEPEDSEGEL